MSERGEEAVRSGEAVMAEAKPDRAAVEAAPLCEDHYDCRECSAYTDWIMARVETQMEAKYAPLVEAAEAVHQHYAVANDYRGPVWDALRAALDAVRGKK